MQRFAILFRLSALSILTLLTGLIGNVAAQGLVTWSDPVNLSNSATGSIHPEIVADAYGYVHVFWCEDVNGREIGPDELPSSTNTILYRRWDGQAWTEPVEILAVAGDPTADFVAAAVDSENQLHLVWTGQTNIYYSTAPAAEAISVRAWSTPQAIATGNARSRYESAVAVDSRGNVHVLYAGGGSAAGVYHLIAAPGNTAWSMPVRISSYLRASESAFMDVRLVIDAADRLHAAWATSSTGGYSQAVYYARSESGGESWDQPTMMADAFSATGFFGFPSLLSYGQDEILLIHVGENSTGRIEHTSADAGKTWSEPRSILSGMEGVNGFLIPLVDSGGNLRLVINMRPSADQRVGIYYAPRTGPDWWPIVPVAVEEPYGPSAHYTAATVRLGSEIHVAWTQLRSGEIWYMRGLIAGVPITLAQSVPAQPEATAVSAQLTAEPTATPSELPVMPAAATGQLPAESLAQPVRSSSAGSALVVALIPVLLLVGGTIIWRMRKR